MGVELYFILLFIHALYISADFWFLMGTHLASEGYDCYVRMLCLKQELISSLSHMGKCSSKVLYNFHLLIMCSCI